MSSSGPRKRYRRPSQRWFAQYAPMTYLVGAAIVGVSVWAFIDPRVKDLLAKENRAIYRGEYWRLISVALVHGGVGHLFFNLGAFRETGRLVESFFGAMGFLLLFALGTGAASVVSMLHTDARAVGASGGIMALMGALVRFAIRYWGLLPSRVRAQIFWAQLLGVVATVGLGYFIPRVDNAAHVGGFVAGFVLGGVVGPCNAVFELLAARRAQAAVLPEEEHDNAESSET